MSFAEHHKELLKKAEEADRLAEATTDPSAKGVWKRIAQSYRDLAGLPTNPSKTIF